MRNRLDFTTSSSTIGSLWVDYRDGYLNLSPKYQRNYVWSDDFKNKLVYSLVKNYPIGSITIRKLSFEQMKGANFKSEVVDGQQRLTTIFKFLDNDFVVRGDDAKLILDDVAEQYTEEELKASKEKARFVKKYREGKKLEFTYDLLPERAKVTINNYNMAISTINQADDNDVAEYFRFVQNQERLRAGEIINAFVECPLDSILTSRCDVTKLSNVLSVDNSRKEIQKAYYGIIGMLDSKLNLGCKDDDIIDFAEKIDERNVSKSIRTYAETIANQLGNIARNCEDHSIKANKRMLKFIMILSGLELEDYNVNCLEKLQGLELFNNRLSAFNSAKKDEIKAAFDKKVFTDEDIENHRLIALITKGGHNKERVVERTKLLVALLDKYYR